MTLEAWPRASASDPELGQFAGWPRTYATQSLLEEAWGHELPRAAIDLPLREGGVLVRIKRPDTGQLLRMMRLGDRTVGSPWRVPDQGPFVVDVLGTDGEVLSTQVLSAELPTGD